MYKKLVHQTVREKNRSIIDRTVIGEIENIEYWE